MKKTVSVILTLVMMLGIMAVGMVQAGAEITPGDTKMYFEIPEGWADATAKNPYYCHIWDPATGVNFATFGAKAEKCTIVNTRLVSYDVDAKLKGKILEDTTYGMVFGTQANQTYNAYFDRTCLGDTAYVDVETTFINPEDSTKLCSPLYFKTVAAGGPARAITNMGLVQGTAYLSGQTDVDLFKTFMTPNATSGKSYYDNALVLSDYKDCQSLIEYVYGQLNNVTYADIAEYLPEEFVIPVEEVKGDVDGDGKMTVMDATMMQKALAKIIDFTDDQTKIADMDGDGKLTIVDPLIICKKLVYLA